MRKVSGFGRARAKFQQRLYTRSFAKGFTPTILVMAKDQLTTKAEYKRILGAAYHDRHLVVCREDGEIWKPPAFDSSYRQLLLRRKLDGPTFHALRHSHATHLLRSGVEPKVI